MTRGKLINMGIIAAALGVMLIAVAGWPLLAGIAGGGAPEAGSMAAAEPAVNQDTASPSDGESSRIGASSAERPGWQLVWQDEFDGANGSAPDPDKWDYDLGGDGWGNDELQNYTDYRRNSYIFNGCLVIKALKESGAGCDYSSARLVTRDLAAWNSGRIEVRALLPHGQGIWPAIWLLPQDDTYGDYRKNGEIDIMEMIGSEPDYVYGSMHYFASGDLHSEVNEFEPSAVSPAVKFHVFAVERDSQAITWYVDDQPVASENLGRIFADPAYKPFQEDFYLLLNIAVGGTWPGEPDASTYFPQRMLVDYVRVYEK